VSRRAVSTVARWEYRRFAKPKDLVIGTLSFVVIFGIFGFVTEFVDRKANEQKKIAVVGGELMGLDPEALAALTAPVSLTCVELEPADGGPKRAEGVTVIIVVGTMLLGLLLGFSYVFIAITGEKTDRVTESADTASSTPSTAESCWCRS
jgi:hypothetical protein